MVFHSFCEGKNDLSANTLEEDEVQRAEGMEHALETEKMYPQDIKEPEETVVLEQIEAPDESAIYAETLLNAGVVQGTYKFGTRLCRVSETPRIC